MTMGQEDKLLQFCQRIGELLKPPAPNQLYVRVTLAEGLRDLSRHLRSQGFYLVTLVGTDERELADNCFKLTYLFSHPTTDLFLFVETPIQMSTTNTTGGSMPSPAQSDKYVTLYDYFRAVDPFERELADVMGLHPLQSSQQERVQAGSWLHECYPPKLYPLRHDRTNAALRSAIENHRHHLQQAGGNLPPDGEWLLPVGPIHAGVIEPGHFLFRLAGEVVEEVTIRLGYTHKGIERLFQTDYTIEDGWRLAEHIGGDSSFAHSLAYCQAAEVLAKIRPSPQAELLRSLILEIERMANHIGDCGALAHDVAYDIVASDMAALREQLLRLNAHVADHRLLRGLNRPGGIVLPRPLDRVRAYQTVVEVAANFAQLAQGLAQLPAFRDRMQWTGILTQQQAFDLGATGLVARASGVRRDFRLQHPVGVYADAMIRELVEQGLPPEDDSIAAREATAGDALARFLIRMRETASSAALVKHILAQSELNSQQVEFVTPIDFREVQNFEFGLGYVEGWRGDIVYWLMKDKFERIFRCKVRDPSMLNWPALKAAVDPNELDEDYVRHYNPPSTNAETIVADFPIINKSFNLSHSGNDL